jgi:MFS family permease
MMSETSSRSSLWRHVDFLKLWTGESISLLGSQITFLALPITAVTWLEATPFEMGLLGALEFAPFLLFSLVAGVWADRLPRRPILISANIGRAILLGSIPLMALNYRLTMGYLYVISFAVGVLTVFFDVAYQSYLPVLVMREQLVEGNSKLEGSRSVAEIAGPAVAGGLIQAFTAPLRLQWMQFHFWFRLYSWVRSAVEINLVIAPGSGSRSGVRSKKVSMWSFTARSCVRLQAALGPTTSSPTSASWC